MHAFCADQFAVILLLGITYKLLLNEGTITTNWST